ncbi:hypothetical protein ACIPYQ_40665 [Streptomyces sp. NPDC090045]|uniref:hypothetical protein n=1 Tax=Streptomyces sp. NPDC090045 TaxID=3365927 RepID=UPI003805E836
MDRAVAAVTAAAANTPTAAPARASAPAPASAAPAPAAAAASAPATAPAAGARVPTDDPWATPTRRVPAPAPAPGPAGPAPAAPAAAPATGAPAAMQRAGEAADPWAAPVPAPAPAPASTDAKRAWGPLTEGLTVPRDLDLGNRPRALKQLKVQPAAHSQMVAMVREVLPEREAGLLIGSRQWPLLAARMQQLGERDGTDTVAQHLNRLTSETSWQEATGTALVGRLVDATLASLTTPPGAPAAARPRVSAAAARSRSTTTLTGAAPGRPAPAEPAVSAYRRQAAPTRRQGRGR